MSNNFTWKITGLDVDDINGHEKCVIRANYSVKGSKGDRTFTYSSNQDIAYEEGEFIEFQALSEEQLLQWLKTNLGQSNIEKIENRVLVALTSPVPSAAVYDNPIKSLMPPWLEEQK
jgi:hypothetical protein